MKRERFKRALWEAFSILLSLIVLIPLYFVVVNSLKTQNEAADMELSLPARIQLIENSGSLRREIF